MSDIYKLTQDVTSRQRETAQAQPRPSRVRVNCLVTGVGETRLKGAKAVQFNTAMLEQPTFSFGMVAIDNVGFGQIPVGSAVVLAWKRNSRGMYTGAEMGFVVQSTKPTIRIRFTLTFEGVSLRTTAGLKLDN
jgi:hypothetical protein